MACSKHLHWSPSQKPRDCQCCHQQLSPHLTFCYFACQKCLPTKLAPPKVPLPKVLSIPNNALASLLTGSLGQASSKSRLVATYFQGRTCWSLLHRERRLKMHPYRGGEARLLLWLASPYHYCQWRRRLRQCCRSNASKVLLPGPLRPKMWDYSRGTRPTRC